TTLKDIVNADVAKGLTKYMLNLPIIVDTQISEANAIYNGTEKVIRVNTEVVGILNSLMHEITHHTQNYFKTATTENGLYVSGGLPILLNSMNKSEADSLINY